MRAAASAPFVPLNARLAMQAPEVPVAEAEPDPVVRAQMPTRSTPAITRAQPAAAVEASRPVENTAPAALPDATYYGARQLDVYPVLTTRLDFATPTGAAARPGPARVLLLVLIDAEGFVNGASVIEAEPQGVYDEHARAAFVSARFRPAMKGGRAVKSRLLVEVDFSEPR